MSTINSFDKNRNLAELTEPLYVSGGSSGWVSAATRQAAALVNLGITVTAAAINNATVAVTDATTYSVLAADTGKVHLMPNLTANCAITLPTAAANLYYKFIYKGVATDGQNWVFGSSGVFHIGGVQFLDSDEPGSGSTLVPVYPNGSSNDFFTVTTPQAGTWVEFFCDGTNWIVNGIVFSATAPAWADT